MPILWERTFEMNIPVIDAQHKQIISCLNELEAAVEEGITPEKTADIITRIRLYTIRHFAMEEKYMLESRYPGLEKQLEAHRHFIERYARIEQEYQDKGPTSPVISSLMRELGEWIKDHVIGLDLLFGAYYRNYLAEIHGAAREPSR